MTEVQFWVKCPFKIVYLFTLHGLNKMMHLHRIGYFINNYGIVK